MQKWLDLLTPSAAALSLLLAIALLVQAIRHGRAVRRLESRLAEREGAAARVSLDRLAQLQRRPRTSSAPVDVRRAGPRIPNLGPAAVVLAVIAVVAGTGWYLFIRDDSSGSAAPDARSTPTATQATTTKAQPIASNVVPENPEPLTQSKGAYTILVLNGSGVTGAAGSIVVPKVQGFGWNTALPGNAPPPIEKTSFVIWLPGKEAVADNVAKDLGIKRKEPVDGFEITQDVADVDAVVIVGLDLATRLTP